jgi:hypothetical protein
MDDRERLAFYPFVLSLCSRQDRLQGLLAQRGLPIGAAGSVYLPDLEQPRPPDLPPGLVRLRVVVSND